MSLDLYLTTEVDGNVVELYECNVTHNLTDMAKSAGIYEAVWHPSDIGITKAKDAAPLIKQGLELVRSDPIRFKRLNPSNGWGDYDGFVHFLNRLVENMEKFPSADVKACG